MHASHLFVEQVRIQVTPMDIFRAEPNKGPLSAPGPPEGRTLATRTGANAVSEGVYGVSLEQVYVTEQV